MGGFCGMLQQWVLSPHNGAEARFDNNNNLRTVRESSQFWVWPCPKEGMFHASTVTPHDRGRGSGYSSFIAKANSERLHNSPMGDAAVCPSKLMQVDQMFQLPIRLQPHD